MRFPLRLIGYRLAAALAALSATCGSSSAAAATAIGTPGASAAADVAPLVEVTYLANEGVVIASGETVVLVDALFGEGIAGYASVAQPKRADLEAARGEFASVDLILATHAHADHFDAGAVARHLAANPGALFVSSPEAVERVRRAPGGDQLSLRLRAVQPRRGTGELVRLGAVTARAFSLHHGRDAGRALPNLGFLVTVGGARILHLGDVEATAEEIEPAGFAELGIDLALIPYWRLLDPSNRADLLRALAPARVAAFHLPTPDAPSSWWGIDGGLEGLRRAFSVALPDAILLTEPDFTIPIPGRLPRSADS